MHRCSGPPSSGQSESPAAARSSPLGEVFARAGPSVLQAGGLSFGQRRVLQRVMACRTAALGGHLHRCTACGHGQPRYNSCRDRHCPRCQALPQARWIAARKERMLPVGHFHVVFTLPGQLRTVAMQAPERLYGLLLKSASTTLQTLAREYLGGQLGITAVLHTWTRELLVHPHVHLIVTAGALSPDGSVWTPTRRGWLFPGRRMAALFRSLILRDLEPLLAEEEVRLPRGLSGPRLLRTLWRKKWVVFAKRPFKTSAHLIEYLGRYTHRVAISDWRVLAVDESGLRFRTRQDKSCRLDDGDFVRRFLRHVLPRGFRKIRHYGLYGPGRVGRRLEQCRALLAPEEEVDAEVDAEAPDSESVVWLDELQRLTGENLRRCPACHSMSVVVEPLGRGPPGSAEAFGSAIT